MSSKAYWSRSEFCSYMYNNCAAARVATDLSFGGDLPALLLCLCGELRLFALALLHRVFQLRDLLLCASNTERHHYTITHQIADKTNRKLLNEM